VQAPRLDFVVDAATAARLTDTDEQAVSATVVAEVYKRADVACASARSTRAKRSGCAPATPWSGCWAAPVTGYHRSADR